MIIREQIKELLVYNYKVSVGLLLTATRLHVGEQDRTEQGSSPPTSPSGNVLVGNSKKGTLFILQKTRIWKFCSKEWN